MIDRYPDEVLLRWFFAMESTRQRVCLKESKEQFESVLDQWKAAPVMVHHTYASLLANRLDQPEVALAHQQLAAEMEPNTTTYQGLAFVFSQLERYEDACLVYEKLVEINPKDSIVWFQWGNVLAYMGDYKAAVEKFETAAQFGQLGEMSYVCWGRCLELLGRPEEGYEVYEMARIRFGAGGLADSYIAISKLYGYGTSCAFDDALEILTIQPGGEGTGIERLIVQVQAANRADNPLGPAHSDMLLKHLLEQAERGDSDAQYGLAMIYRHGVVVKKNIEESGKWLARAAENGLEVAKHMTQPPFNDFSWPKIDANCPFLGTWSSENSVVVYEMSRKNGDLVIQSCSSSSGREMLVGNVVLKGDELHFSSYMPATDHKTDHMNQLLSKRKMESIVMLNGEEHVRIYKKQRSGK